MVEQLLLNLSVTLAIVALVRSDALPVLVFGFGVGGILTWLAARAKGQRFYLVPVWGMLRLLARLFAEQIKASVAVAWLVVNPRSRPEPGIIEVPLSVRKPWQKVMVANMITLTPGSVSTMFSPDRTRLYVHAVDVNPTGHIVQSVRLFEHLVRGVWE